MSWWFKITLTDTTPELHGPFDTEEIAQTEADQCETDGLGTCDAPYEADADEPSRFPRPISNVATKEGWVERWTDGSRKVLS